MYPNAYVEGYGISGVEFSQSLTKRGCKYSAGMGMIKISG
jgi:hypothetical protein